MGRGRRGCSSAGRAQEGGSQLREAFDEEVEWYTPMSGMRGTSIHLSYHACSVGCFKITTNTRPATAADPAYLWESVNNDDELPDDFNENAEAPTDVCARPHMNAACMHVECACFLWNALRAHASAYE